MINKALLIHDDFPFSMGGCVLYLPLWQEYMQGSPVLSRDPYHYSCVVTGAVWGTTGRTLDGSDDKLKNTTANFRTADSAGTILAWVKVASDDAEQCIFGSGDIGTDTSFIALKIETTANGGVLKVVQQNAGDAADAVKGSTDVGDDAWHFATLISSGTVYSMYVDNGAAETLAVAAGANNGDWFADTTLRDNFTIGIDERSSTRDPLGGIIGDVLVYNRALSTGEVAHIYQMTKWRYS